MTADTLEAPAPVEHPLPTLTGHDRCDSCGAQAYIKVEFLTGELLFCAHHFTKSRDNIMKTAVSVVDESWQLTSERLDVSA